MRFEIDPDKKDQLKWRSSEEILMMCFAMAPFLISSPAFDLRVNRPPEVLGV